MIVVRLIVGNPPHVAAICIHYEDIIIAVSVRDEGNLFAVR
jgi:hypothetical protein